MQRKLVFAAFLGLIVVLGLSSVAYAQLSVGVKKGDWIEYQVAYAGTPEEGHAITAARMDILGVQGTDIDVMITSTDINGTVESSNVTLNLENGHLIDAFIIPAELKNGDKFFDQTLGNVTITSSQRHQYAGATRTVLSATVNGQSYNDKYTWDQATGVSVEGNSQTSNYTMHSIVTATNIWQPTPAVDIITIYVAIVAVIAVVVVAAAVMLVRKKKPAN